MRQLSGDQRTQIRHAPHFVVQTEEPRLIDQIQQRLARAEVIESQEQWSIYYDGQCVIHFPLLKPTKGPSPRNQKRKQADYQAVFGGKTVVLGQLVSQSLVTSENWKGQLWQSQIDAFHQLRKVDISCRIVVMECHRLAGLDEFLNYCRNQFQLFRLKVFLSQSVEQALQQYTLLSRNWLLKCESKDYLQILLLMRWIEQSLVGFHYRLSQGCPQKVNLSVDYYFISTNPELAHVSDPFQFHDLSTY